MAFEAGNPKGPFEQNCVTDSTADDLADFSGIQALHLQAEEAERQRAIRRTLTGIGVALLHVLIVFAIVISSRIPLVKHIRETVPEAIWILLPQTPAPVKPKTQEPQPEVAPAVTAPPQITSPITVPAVKTPKQQQEPTGTLEDIGRALNCGATLYENLPAYLRDQCRRHPWAFIRKSDGTIVLDAPKPDAVPSFTGGDINRHEMQTAPACPPLINVPCLSKVLPNRDPVTNGSLDGH